MAERLKKHNLSVILIQIDEAHSTEWPNGLPDIPEPQKNMNERVERANRFVEEDKPPYSVYVDGWDNIFAETFRAWPDQYYCIDQEFKTIGKSEYGKRGDALIDLEYTDLLEQLMQSE